MTTRWLTVREVAAHLRFSTSWVRQHARGVKRPLLPGERIGREWRFREDRLREWEESLGKMRRVS